MKIIIDIPKEFEEHFKQDKFQDALYRLSADAHLMAGNYEQETATMLIKAFDESIPMEKQKECSDCAGCTAWKCDCSNIRNKAIDDFAEKLSEVCHEQSFEVSLGAGHFTAGLYAEVLTLDGLVEIIFDVAEQLKAGGVE